MIDEFEDLWGALQGVPKVQKWHKMVNGRAILGPCFGHLIVVNCHLVFEQWYSQIIYGRNPWLGPLGEPSGFRKGSDWLKLTKNSFFLKQPELAKFLFVLVSFICILATIFTLVSPSCFSRTYTNTSQLLQMKFKVVLNSKNQPIHGLLDVSSA